MATAKEKANQPSDCTKVMDDDYIPPVNNMGKPRKGVNAAERKQNTFAAPINVPACLTARQYLSMTDGAQPDP